MANANPSGLGAFEFNLRFPGQYFDKETSLHYNYFRDYSAEIGRYVQGDPLGLTYHLNPYSYANFNPLSYFDPTGEATTLAWCFGGPAACAAGATAAIGSLIWAQSQTARSKKGVSSTSANHCDDTETDCWKASKWELLQARIVDAEEYKKDNGAIPVGHYDICKCRDGSIRIAKVGQCGRTRDFWD